MRKIHRVVALLVWPLAAACGNPAGAQLDTQVSARLQRILADSAAANGAIGSQGAVRIPGYQPWLGVTGLNGVADSMRTDLLIGTGSISKMYTAIAALVLVDRGVLHLDDQVVTWFPGTANVAPSLRLQQLLDNTSGLADYGAAPGYSAAILSDLSRSWAPAELLAFVGPPLFPAGTAWNASNTNRLLLGMIVERETGVSLGDFMRANLFPGRSQTWLTGDGTPPGEVAAQWYVNGAGQRTNYTATLFGPALFSSRREIQASAGDLAEFAQRLFGGDLLTPATRGAMLTIVPDDGGIAGQTGGGLGVRRYNFLGRTLYGHSGGTQNSSAMILFDPATGAVATVSINQDGPSHSQSHFRTAQALLKEAIAVASGH